jgi:hypothetical protein
MINPGKNACSGRRLLVAGSPEEELGLYVLSFSLFKAFFWAQTMRL